MTGWRAEARGVVLVGAVDDATGELVHALLRELEDGQGYFLLLREVVRRRRRSPRLVQRGPKHLRAQRQRALESE